MTVSSEYLLSVIKRLSYYKELGDKTFKQLTEAEFHFQPNDESNSIAIIIQHQAGNMLSRWTDFLSADGEKEWRHRDEEFEEMGLSREQLLAIWEKGWSCCLNALEGLNEADLVKTIYIRQEGLLAIDAINRQLAHYPYHVGQILYIGRMIKGAAWKNLSIEKGGSVAFNNDMKGS